MDEQKTLKKFKELRQRNFVAKHAQKSGAGKHVDRKRQMKQGYFKHKNLTYAE